MRVEHWLYTLPLRLRSLFRRNQLEHELDEELAYHLDQKTKQYIAQGMSSDGARRAALRSMGGLEQLKEECRDSRKINWIQDFIQDIRFGIRILSRTPVITAVATLSLALGIGANTAIFSLIDTVVLRMLPVQRPAELVQLKRFSPKHGGPPAASFTNPLWEQIRAHQEIFSSAFAWSDERFNLSHGGPVAPVSGLYVSGDYFNSLGVRPSAGRLLTTADDHRGCPSLAVLSFGFWQNHFAGAPSAIGSTLSINNHPFQIIGVAAPGFYGAEIGNKFELAVPICSSEVLDASDARLVERSFWWLNIVGRKNPGIADAQLTALLDVASPQIMTGALPADWEKKDRDNFLLSKLIVSPAATGLSQLREQFAEPLNVLMAVVGLVLLIACANIASLMLARAAARNKEIAVRKVLGASRTRLIRQLLTECLLLSSAGALLGILLAHWGAALLVRFISTSQSHVFLELSLNSRVLGFTATIAFLTALLFGVFPALRSTRVSLTAAMKGNQVQDIGPRVRIRPGKWIVASQVALSLILVIVAGLFLHSLVNLTTLEIGFDRSNVLLISANLAAADVPAAQRPVVYDDLEERLSVIPGVSSVGRSIRTPVSNFEWDQQILSDSPNAPKGEDANAFLNFVSPGYFQTLRTPVLQGRGFSSSDTKSSPLVVIVNETLARQFFPGESPLGKYVTRGEIAGKTTPPIEIIGIVKDAKYESLRENTPPQAFFPASQIGEHDETEFFEIRSSRPPSALTSLVKDTFAQANPAISLEFHSLAQQVDDSLVQERLLATLSAFFGALALLLAMIGVYGAISYLVTLRRTEFGIRMALGAPSVSILRLVLRDAGVVLLVGSVAGLLISLLSVRVLQKFLFGLTPHDPAVFLAAAAVLSAVALFAGYIPARRAMRTDPMVALRYD